MAGFVINEDNSHYYYDRGLSGVNEEKMREMTQHYCRGQAVEVIYNLNSMRSSVAGLPFEPIWYEIDDRGKDGLYYAGEKISEASENWILSAKK